MAGREVLILQIHWSARVDLAAAMLRQVVDDSYVGKAMAVTTTTGTPTLWQLLRKEAGSKQ
jgi:hypothetical protein